MHTCITFALQTIQLKPYIKTEITLNTIVIANPFSIIIFGARASNN